MTQKRRRAKGSVSVICLGEAEEEAVALLELQACRKGREGGREGGRGADDDKREDENDDEDNDDSDDDNVDLTLFRRPILFKYLVINQGDNGVLCGGEVG